MRLKSMLHPIDAINRKRLSWYVQTKEFYQLIDSDRKKALEIWWKLSTGKDIDWNHPSTLNEKIQWLEAFTDTSLWTEYSDKYKVRKYIEDLGLGEHLTKLYGVWERVEDIDYSQLPDSFAIKCNHDCGSTIIIKDKEKELDIVRVNQELKKHLEKPFGYEYCEPHYIKIERKVIAEELLPFPIGGKNAFSSSSMVDYKIWCINGKAEISFTCYDRILDGPAVFDLYSIDDWHPRRNLLSPKYQKQHFKDVPRPKNLEKMIKIAECIAKGFPQVRIDLYNIDGKIYFGEMTFTSQAGRMNYFSDEFQKEIGKKMILPE